MEGLGGRSRHRGSPHAILMTAMLLAVADPDQILQELSTDLMSPYCPGRTIAACPSGQARQLEDHILAEAKAGKTRDEIEASLVGRFGPEIVGYAPQPLLLYGSAVVGIIALVALVFMARRWVRTQGSGDGMAAAGAGADGAATPTQAELDRPRGCARRGGRAVVARSAGPGLRSGRHGPWARGTWFRASGDGTGFPGLAPTESRAERAALRVPRSGSTASRAGRAGLP